MVFRLVQKERGDLRGESRSQLGSVLRDAPSPKKKKKKKKKVRKNSKPALTCNQTGPTKRARREKEGKNRIDLASKRGWGRRGMKRGEDPRGTEMKKKNIFSLTQKFRNSRDKVCGRS